MLMDVKIVVLYIQVVRYLGFLREKAKENIILRGDKSVLGKMGANWAPADWAPQKFGGKLGPGKSGPFWGPICHFLANWVPANWAPADWAP